MKKGFSAYEEIQKLANDIYKGQDVSVIASIFGNDYEITVDGVQVFKGTSENAYSFLSKDWADMETKKQSDLTTAIYRLQAQGVRS